MNDSFTQCLQNGDFDQPNAGNNLSDGGGCNYIGDNSVPNWRRSHGTPNINTPTNNPIDNYIYMWSAVNTQYGVVGEGIVGNYNFFANISYSISIRCIFQTSTPATSNFQIWAANGIPIAPSLASPPFCGQNIPAIPVSNRQNVATNNQATQVMTVFNYTFIPQADFSQVWIYPQSTTTNQCALLLDYVFICADTCNGTVNYNKGEAPSGISKFKIINAGSTSGSGGSGIVTVSSSVNTNFYANQEVNLVSDFDATVSGNTAFNAQIVPCSTGVSKPFYNTNTIRNNYPATSINESTRPNIDSIGNADFRLSKLKIRPNPSKYLVYIKLDNIKLGNTIIEIRDTNGRLVLKKSEFINNLNQSEIPVKIHALNSGIYFLTVKTKEYSTTNKLIINK